MWYPFNTNQPYRHQFSLSRFAYRSSATLLATVGMIWTVDAIAAPRTAFAQPASAQLLAQAPAPTLRYAQGENVDLAEIVSEWRGFYEDVPVYLCVCQEDTCNQTQQWPFREYLQYEMSVALGPTNGQTSETAGSKCFDIADGSRPSTPRDFVIAEATDPAPAAPPVVAPPPPAAAPPVTPPRDVNNADDVPSARPVVTPRPTPPSPPASTTVPQPAAVATAQPINSGAVPTAIAINQGADIQLTWPSGASNVVAVAGSNWNINILDAADCDTRSPVDQKTYEATRIIGEPAVDAITGNVAVPVLLSTCADVDQSAIFILDPNEGGGYSLYRSQFVGDRDLPNEFSSYAFSTIRDARYWDGSLFVRHNDNSGTDAVVIFRRAATPAGTYAGCAIVAVGESNLCPQ